MDITETFKEEKNKETNSPIFLFTIYDAYYEDSEWKDLNLAEWDENITFDSVLYSKFPITHDEIGENSQGEIDAVKVSLANVSRVIQYYLENYDYRGKKVRIRLVWKDRLAYPDDKMDFIYYIDSYLANKDVVEFTLMPKTDVLDVTLQ